MAHLWSTDASLRPGTATGPIGLSQKSSLKQISAGVMSCPAPPLAVVPTGIRDPYGSRAVPRPPRDMPGHRKRLAGRQPESPEPARVNASWPSPSSGHAGANRKPRMQNHAQGAFPSQDAMSSGFSVPKGKKVRPVGHPRAGALRRRSSLVPAMNSGPYSTAGRRLYGRRY